MMIRKKESSHINDRKRMLDQQPREEKGGWRGPFSPETSCSRCRNRTHATVPNAKLLHDVDALPWTVVGFASPRRPQTPSPSRKVWRCREGR